MREQKNIFQNIDWITIGIYLALVLIGWMNIYSAVYNDEHTSIFDFSQSYGKQMIWIVCAIVIALIIMSTDIKFFPAFSYIFYAIVIVLLIGVLLFGSVTAGSKSWFLIGSFKLQPSEFAKFATCLAISKYLSTTNIRMQDIRTKMLSALILGFPAILILLQNDTGSAIVYVAFIFVLYREGLSGNVLIVGLFAIVLFFLSLLINKFIIIGALVLVALIFFMYIRKRKKEIFTLAFLLIVTSGFVFSVDYVYENVLESHQKDRIDVLTGKIHDYKGVGYNVNQSKIAIGSGGFFGKGFLQGTQTKFDFVPEQSTDFIYCTVGEEWGFVGSLLVIVLYVWLFLRIIFMAERQRSTYARIYGYGVASILFFHFTINIAMTIGLAPVIGIPLPFISYGGSSLWAFTMLLFVFVKQDANRLLLL
ncbi:MAG TPA: rod shape-determining protein RodA [Bacteroidales bacterium]|nr:rod shape-determining protein RodA [Bacteroidales bacterium]HPS16794.1 rod shape-determining protein RodA [Bacteroidales bacterium]